MYNFHKHDVITGTVIGFNNCGCLVRDDESDKVVFYFGNGMKGDRVRLSVDKVDRERERVTCVLESVLGYGRFAA